MPLFQRRSGKTDPTRHWVGDTRFPLDLDLATHSLSGVPLGGLIDRFAGLGPAEDREAALEGQYRYGSRGLEIDAENATVTAYRIVWAGDPEFGPFRGSCRRGDERLALGPQTTEEDLLRLLGAPYWRDADDQEILLFYEFPPVEWQIELTREGTLAQWTLVTPPLMAGEAQRRAYGVTKPWPPDGRLRPRSARPR